MAKQSRIREIIIHYTATYDDQPVTRETVDGWHRARGWAGIGYHFLIHQDGRMDIGRALDVVGAHAPPNTGRVGICYVGGLRRASGAGVGLDTRTPAQIATMTRLIRELLSGRRDTAIVTVDPAAPVRGHRDVGNTQCPGFDAGAWWRAVSTGAPAPAPAPRPDVPVAPVRTEDVAEDPRAPAVAPDQAAGGSGAAVLVTGVATGKVWLIVIGAVLLAAGGLLFLRRK